MSSSSVRKVFLPLAAVVGLSLGVAAPAAAGDDGQAPIWVGISGVLGLTDTKEEMPIEYRERSKLVLPPKIVLPPPAAHPVTNAAAWPIDPDVQRVIRKNAETKNMAANPRRTVRQGNGLFPADAVVTVRADAGQGPATRPCVTGSSSRDCQSPGFGLFSALGFGGKVDPASLGPEPDRDWLTDPPKGYRAPLATGSSAAK